MRKIFYILGIILLVLMVNFTMWFVHTRTIHNSLIAFKKQLALYKIDLLYDDLFFKNFKAWNVEGVVSKVRFRLNSKNPHIISIDRINIISKPYKEHLELQTDGQLNYIQTDGDKEKVYNIEFHNGSPSIEVDFLTSLNTLNDSLDAEEDETPHILRNIKNIKYYDSGLDLIDSEKNARYLILDGNKFSLVNNTGKNSRKYDIISTIQGLRFDPEYPSDINNGTLDKTSISTGTNSAHIDISLQFQPSEHQLEFIKKIKENDKDAKIKKVLDSFKITFNDANFSSEQITSSLHGTIDKQPNSGLIPYMDLQLVLSDYAKCIDHYFITLNGSINKLVASQPLLPIKSISPAQIDKFKQFSNQFSADNKDLTLNLLKTKDIDFNISGKPIKDLIDEVQAIFFSNFGSIEPPKPQSTLPSRLSKVAK